MTTVAALQPAVSWLPVFCTTHPHISTSVSLPGDNGQMWWTHAGAHEQHHVLVAGVAVGHHLALEGLELVLVVTLDVDQADGDLAVPAPVENLAEAPLADHLADLQLLEGDVPLLQEDAGLAGLAREVASRQQRQVHLLELVARVLVVALLVLRRGRKKERVETARLLFRFTQICSSVVIKNALIQHKEVLSQYSSKMSNSHLPFSGLGTIICLNLLRTQ